MQATLFSLDKLQSVYKNWLQVTQKKITFYTRPILNDNQNPGSHLSPFAKRQQKCFLIKGQAITGFGFFEAALDDRVSQQVLRV